MNVNEFLDNYNILSILSLKKHSEVLLVKNKKDFDMLEIVKILKNKNKEDLEKSIEILKRIDHENILSPYSVQDMIYNEGNSFGKILTYEKCDQDLYDFLTEREFQLSNEMKYNFILQMARAIEYLHNINIVHTDIKLENFVVKKEGNSEYKIFLIDTENAIKQKHNQTVNYNPNESTYFYRSPETFEDFVTIDAKAVDIYSLGVCFHSIMSTFFPYAFNDDNDDSNDRVSTNNDESGDCGEYDNTYSNIKNGILSLARDYLSEMECDLISKMLNKDPSERINISQVFLHPLFSNIIDDN
eukprot:TRINITY_DN4579_c0_g1_i1.p1 TRINITY_DN4579_c0_g1~~TRINITY_DN4579_c0_g1_i1.p1  ORF type:complete len:300 (+),score=33.68 TRINITY_DN4579_c0_g1_i1:192-1091(+)